jgi:hypothetical protein
MSFESHARHGLRAALGLTAAFLAFPAIAKDDIAAAQKALASMDMTVMQKWSAAKTVKYRAEGVHKARAAVVFGDYEGKADVLDRVIVEFNWDVRKGKIVGPVTVVDGKSELANIKSDGTNCPPPQLAGEYEHFTSVSHAMTAANQIQITGTRIYPAAKVSNYPASCSMRSIGGSKQQALLWVAPVAPEALGMPVMPNRPIAVAADRKSFSVKAAENWVWTYTPTLVE